MIIDIRDKRVLITASTEGIGKGIARAFAREGCSLTITSRSQEKVRNTLEELRQINKRVYGITSDITNISTLKNLVDYAINNMGGIDILIINTGNPPKEPAYFTETEISDWEYSLKLYLLGPIYLVMQVYPYMIKQRWGRIIFLSSWTVKEPQNIFSLADVSRAPLIQLSKILSREFGKYNITVNTVLMGSFETPGAKRTLQKLAERLGVDFNELWNKYVISQSALLRTGDIEKELGSLLIYLSSDYGSYITGSYILIDGGTTHSI
ncbi:MAG: SDR family oxidoreductase [Sulfolobaceae archaeon]